MANRGALSQDPERASNRVGLGWLAVLVVCLVPILWVAWLIVLYLLGAGDH
jgi:hypothetical protein